MAICIPFSRNLFFYNLFREKREEKNKKIGIDIDSGWKKRLFVIESIARILPITWKLYVLYKGCKRVKSDFSFNVWAEQKPSTRCSYRILCNIHMFCKMVLSVSHKSTKKKENFFFKEKELFRIKKAVTINTSMLKISLWNATHAYIVKTCDFNCSTSLMAK